jgi:MATE family multidrug resistance protein
VPTDSRKAGAFRLEFAALLRLGPPLMLASLGTTFMSTVDVWMVSPIGKTALGAVALGSSYATTVTFIAMGLLAPIDSLVAQMLGGSEAKDVGAVFRAGLKLALLIAIPTTLLLAFPELAMRALVGSDGSEELVRLASGYCRPLALSLPGFLVYAAIRDFVMGHSRPLPELSAVVFANLVNLAGNWLLIGGRAGFPALGTAGCAWATAIAQMAMLVAMLAFVRVDPQMRRSTRLAAGTPKGQGWRIARLGLPLAAVEGLRIGFLTVIAGIMERLGPEALAGNQIALSIGLLAHTIPLGFGWAVGIRVASQVATDPRATRRTLLTGYTLGGVFAAVIACLYFLAGGWIARQYGADPEMTVQTAQILHAWAFLQVALALASIGGNALFGFLDIRFVAGANVIALYAIALPVAWLLGIELSLGPAMVWVGPVLAQTALVVLFVRRFWVVSGRPASDQATPL